MVTSVDRTNIHEFVCQYKNPDFYLSRCFATLYPYGRGCPSDKSCGGISNAKYVKHMLCLGGGPSARRFQQSSSFIFCMYTMEMKRKLGGVAYTAQKKHLDGSIAVVSEPPNICDINHLLAYLEDTVVNDYNVPALKLGRSSETSTDGLSNNQYDEREMLKLIKRLIPYSQSLQGTVTHIMYERAKLMAMIPSPIINRVGLWRLFFTVAPADLYECRFFEVVQAPISDFTTAFWNERVQQVGQIYTFFI